MLAARLAATCRQVTPIISSNDSQLVVITYEALDTIKGALDRHDCTGQGQSTTLFELW